MKDERYNKRVAEWPELAPCATCGKPLVVFEAGCGYSHPWDRWPGDNGYYCYQGGRATADLSQEAHQRLKNEGRLTRFGLPAA